MVLVVGGKASGKRSYAIGLGFSEADVSDGVLDGKPVLLNAQDVIAADGRSAEELAGVLAAKRVVCCCEVGSGVVPLDAAERARREKVGRTCKLLAERADEVVRMVCGIPVKLKGASDSMVD